MTDQHAPRSPQLPPEHRRRWLIWTMVVVIAAVGLVVGGPWVYAHLAAQDPAKPLTLTTATPEASATGAPTPEPLDLASLEGSWQVSDGSQAGYRLGEVLSGQQVTVVGRTEQVSGTVVVSGGSLTTADVVVDAGSIATDESARDAYFRRALDTTDFPQATFVLTGPVDLSPVSGAAGPVTLDVPGTLTFHGTSLPVTATLQVQGTAAGVEVVGTIPVLLEDFGLEPPDLGFVTVEPSGTVEMLLVLTRPAP